MQDREKIYLTKEGKEKLQIELEDLEGPQRTEIAARLKSAIEKKKRKSIPCKKDPTHRAEP